MLDLPFSARLGVLLEKYRPEGEMIPDHNRGSKSVGAVENAGQFGTDAGDRTQEVLVCVDQNALK
jgi:hypothetical protein